MALPRISLTPELSITRVITGLWQVADMERGGVALDTDLAARAMAHYVREGFTSFDMADHYGSAELIAGLCQQQYAGVPLQLFTKWVPSPGPITRAAARDAVTRALHRLRAERIDLMQFHAWNFTHPEWLDCLLWLNEFRQEGLIHAIGTTNFDTVHLRLAHSCGIPITSNQVCYSLLDQRAAGDMTAFCLAADIKLLAFGTLAGGFLSERWLGQPEPGPDNLKTWSQMKYKRFIDAAGGWEKFQNLLRILDILARQTEHTIANVATRYMLQQPAVGGIIVGARLGETDHLQDNLSLFDFNLTAEQQQHVREALAHLLPIPGDCGDEYRKPPFLTASGDLSHHVASVPPAYPTRSGVDGSTLALSGTPWEEIAGFARAIRKGNSIHISGTTATHGSLAVGGADAALQAHFILDKIEGALQSLGAGLEQVVRTRIYIRNLAGWEAVARVHGERFRHVQPANTMVRADLVGDEYLVEIEAEAQLS